MDVVEIWMVLTIRTLERRAGDAGSDVGFKGAGVKWVGLTGGIGSGKSSVAEWLRQHGWTVIDADQVARQVIQKETPGYREVIQAFGPGVLDSAANIDRAKLAAIVFADPKRLRVLEGITHPRVQSEVARQRTEAEQKGATLAFYDVPLLFEKQLEGQFDAILLVWCPREAQIHRAMARSGYSLAEVQRRMAQQISLDQKRRSAHVVIDNSGAKNSLPGQIQKALEELKNRFSV